MTHDLTQAWPAPGTPRPIVICGAGGIVRDAHLPAYAMAGLTVGGCDRYRPGPREGRPAIITSPASFRR